MTTEASNPRPYHLHLLADCRWYDYQKSHLFYSWHKGEVVSDPRDIELLEALGAPCERISVNPDTH
jgi:hypothetical protein